MTKIIHMAGKWSNFGGKPSCTVISSSPLSISQGVPLLKTLQSFFPPTCLTPPPLWVSECQPLGSLHQVSKPHLPKGPYYFAVMTLTIPILCYCLFNYLQKQPTCR